MVCAASRSGGKRMSLVRRYKSLAKKPWDKMSLTRRLQALMGNPIPKKKGGTRRR